MYQGEHGRDHAGVDGSANVTYDVVYVDGKRIKTHG